jgi:competence protein ComFB
MAKKSNKTEQVLKLITKDEETLENLMEKENPKHQEPKAHPEQELEVIVKEKEEQELKYEAKLKIEIDPEVQLKAKKKEEEDMTIFQNADGAESALIGQSDHLVNVSEMLVKEKLASVMEKMKVCDCEACVNDVLALALNTLPTKYVTTDGGRQYSQLEIYKKQYETDVLAALTKACVRVKASPRHK